MHESSPAANAAPKSPAVAYLLWFFLGGFGAHRFYMGRTGSGLGMAGLCVGSIVLTMFVIGLLGFPVLAIWWIVDAFLLNNWLKEQSVAAAPAGTVQPEMSKAA